MDLAHCSLNSVTARAASLEDLVPLAAGLGFGGVGLWRDCYQRAGPGDAARRVEDAGLRVTSVCRAGMFPQPTPLEREWRRTDNLRAIDEARVLAADCLVLVCGAACGGDLDAARGAIRDGIEMLLPHAESVGVPLAVEPMHPMMAADRSAIASLGEAVDLVRAIDHPMLGLALDSYHLWWDAALDEGLNRAVGAVLTVQLADWVLPIHGQLSSRGMPGDGVIEIDRFVRRARAAGFDGLVEVEVLSDRWWAAGPVAAARAAATALRAIADAAPYQPPHDDRLQTSSQEQATCTDPPSSPPDRQPT